MTQIVDTNGITWNTHPDKTGELLDSDLVHVTSLDGQYTAWIAADHIVAWNVEPTNTRGRQD